MTPISDLIPLHTGQPGLRTMLQVEVHSPGTTPAPGVGVGAPADASSSPLSPLPPVKSGPDPIRDNSCNSCLDFISSDETLDRYGEIITPTGWDLTNYRRNPVFQNAHQYGDIIFTLGRALVTEVRSGKLFQRIQFATDANPLAKIAHSLYAGKFLNAVSVGFIPRRWQDGVGQASSPAGEGGVSPPFRRKYIEQELLEVSAVSIPANPNAMALAVKTGAIEKSDLKNTADLINYTLACASPSPRGEGRGEGELSPNNPSIHQSTNPSLPSLLALSRELRNLLRHL